MNVTVETSRVFLPRKTRGTLQTVVGRAFSQLNRRVKRVRMTLERVPGAHRDRQKVCMISAELADGGQVVVVDRRDKLRRAMIQCLRRSKALVAYEVRRRQLRKRQRAHVSDETLTAGLALTHA